MDKTTAFGLPFFYRVVIPGGVATLLMFPVLVRLLEAIGVRPEDQAFALATVALLGGIVLAALDAPIYELLEGRRLWPEWLYGLRTRRWQQYVRRLDARQARLARTPPGSRQYLQYLEVWDQLRRFPVDDEGDPHATRPTQLGNLLASYEDYPDRVYGMHPVAFWSRLWLKLDKDVREEVDRAWALPDGLLYVSAAMLFTGLLYPVLALVSAILAGQGLEVLFGPDERVVAAVFGPLLCLAALIPYQASLAGQMTNGDLMKSLFDAFRDRLKDVKVPASPDEKRAAREMGKWFTYGAGDEDDDEPKPRGGEVM